MNNDVNLIIFLSFFWITFCSNGCLFYGLVCRILSLSALYPSIRSQFLLTTAAYSFVTESHNERITCKRNCIPQ